MTSLLSCLTQIGDMKSTVKSSWGDLSDGTKREIYNVLLDCHASICTAIFLKLEGEIDDK